MNPHLPEQIASPPGRILRRFCLVDLYQAVRVLVFLLPIEVRFRISKGLPSITILEIMTYAVSFFFFASVCLRRETREEWGRRIKMVHRSNRGFFRYFLWVLIAFGINAPESAEMARALKDLVPAFLLFLMIVLLRPDPDRLTGFGSAFLAGMLVSSVLGIVQVHSGGYYMGELHEITIRKTDPQGNRVDNLAMGFFAHPNGYAMFLLPAALIALGAFVYRRDRGLPERAYIAGILFLVLYNLSFTYARGAMAYGLLGAVLLFVFQRLRQPAWRFGIALFAWVLGIISVSIAGAYMFLEYGGSYGTVIGRFGLWIAGATAVLGDPRIALFGGGFERTRSLTQGLWFEDIAHAHNGYINQAIYYGIPSLVFFLWIIIASFRNLAFSGGKTVGIEGHEKAVFLSILVSVFGYYFFEPAQIGVAPQALVFAIFAATTSLSHMGSPNGL